MASLSIKISKFFPGKHIILKFCYWPTPQGHLKVCLQNPECLQLSYNLLQENILRRLVHILCNTKLQFEKFDQTFKHVPGPPALITAGKATEPVAAWPTLFVWRSKYVPLNETKNRDTYITLIWSKVYNLLWNNLPFVHLQFGTYYLNLLHTVEHTCRAAMISLLLALFCAPCCSSLGEFYLTELSHGSSIYQVGFGQPGFIYYGMDLVIQG